jgi:spore germination protein GerM
MAKRKKAVAKTANPVALSSTNVATESTNSSPAPASKKAAKTPKKKVVPKTPLETKTVCFTDQDSGKRFCGEMTEVPEKKAPAKVAGTKRRAASRRR